jgi:alanine racemase
MLKAQETVLEINLKALKHNFEYLKSKLQPETRFLAVVKAFAYGNDATEIAKYLQDLDIDYFAVAYANEGVALRKSGVTTPILVLHTLAVNFDVIIENSLEPNLYNAKILNEFIAFAQAKIPNEYPVHIKFNTGLNRLGFSRNDVDDVVTKIKATKAIKVKSLFSHLAASEDLNERDFTLQQIQTFKTIAKKFQEQIGYMPILHMCNTSGILNYPKAHFNMVRSGIGLYGFGNSKKESVYLKPIASLKTVISQIHTIEQGESVGYNRAFKSNSFIKTATLPLGHADGIGRIYGKGNGFVTIHGKKAPIIGNVCMDMIMVNVTDIDCKEGDEVIVFDGKITSAETLAESANTISYELITSISQRVKRVILK